MAGWARWPPKAGGPQVGQRMRLLDSLETLGYARGAPNEPGGTGHGLVPPVPFGSKSVKSSDPSGARTRWVTERIAPRGRLRNQ